MRLGVHGSLEHWPAAAGEQLVIGRLIAALLVCIGVELVIPFASGAEPTAKQASAPSLPGSLLFIRGGAIWQLNMSTREQRPLLGVEGGSVTAVAHSPDRQRIAYSALHLGQNYEVLSTEIVVANADGSNAQSVVREQGGATAVVWPVWNGSGSRLLYTATGLLDATSRLEETDLASGSRSVVLKGGSSAALSADDRWLAYDVLAPAGWGIWSFDRVAAVETRLVPETWFVDSDLPTFSPDASSLIFVAAGAGPPANGLQRVIGLIGAALLPVAEAHDLPVPFDLWSIRLDGSDLRRLAELRNQQPYLAWSPDARFIAAWGGNGLQVVDTANNYALYPLLPDAGNGGITWGL